MRWIRRCPEPASNEPKKVAIPLGPIDAAQALLVSRRRLPMIFIGLAKFRVVLVKYSWLTRYVLYELQYRRSDTSPTTSFCVLMYIRQRSGLGSGSSHVGIEITYYSVHLLRLRTYSAGSDTHSAFLDSQSIAAQHLAVQLFDRSRRLVLERHFYEAEAMGFIVARSTVQTHLVNFAIHFECLAKLRFRGLGRQIANVYVHVILYSLRAVIGGATAAAVVYWRDKCDVILLPDSSCWCRI